VGETVGAHTDGIIAELRRRLLRVRIVKTRRRLLRGSVRSVLAAAVVAVILLALESIAPMSAPLRSAAVLAGLAGVVAVAIPGVVLPMLDLLGIRSAGSELETAAEVGRALPELRDRMVNALQLHQESSRGTVSGSKELIEAALEDLQHQVAPVDLERALGPFRIAPLASVAGSMLGVLALLLLVFPGSLGRAGVRLLYCTREFVTPPAFTLVVSPGDEDVIRGSDVVIRARALGVAPSQAYLQIRPEGQVSFDEEEMRRDTAGEFRASLPGLRRSLEYRVRAADQRSDAYRLRVIDRPIIRVLRLGLEFPSYTGLGARQLDDNVGDVVALKGTVIRVRLESSAELARAELVLDGVHRRPLTVTGSTASGTLRLERDQTYHIALEDTAGTANADPVEYRIRAVADRAPTVVIRLPGQDLDVTETTVVGLVIHIEDDYGFSGLRLVHRLVHSRYEPEAAEASVVAIPLPANSGVEAFVPYQWDLKPLLLASEDVVEYFVEVLDNDRISGPKHAVSDTYRLRLPSLDEILAEAEHDQESSLGTLEEALEQAKQAHEELEKLRREMTTRPDQTEWEARQQADNMMERYQSIQQQVEHTLQRIEEMTQKLNQQQLLSPETLEKFMELQALMEEMSTPEFREAMRKLQEAMQRLDPEAIRRAMEQLSLSEETFRRSIERTINLLKRIQIEQKLDAILRQTEQMLQEQESLRDASAELATQERRAGEDLMARQQDVARQLERLQESLGGLQEQMEEFPGEMPREELQAARDSLAQSALEGELDRIQEAMRAGSMSEAHQRQQRAAGTMQAVRDQVAAIQEALRANQQRQVANEMRRALQDLLELSQRQERLRQESEASERGSPGQRERAQEQMEIGRDLSGLTQRLGALSQKTFGITPEMGKAIGDAQRAMGEAIGSLEQRDARSAGSHQQEAMGSLNEAAQMMQWSLQAMMQGGQGMGMAGFMQRLEQLAGQQQGINQGTRSLGGMTQQQAAALSRLAGEQAAARRSLEELAREAAGAGELSKLLGDLTRIAQEMREVQTDLVQGQVNPETLQKQDRILSRLLDSQRSLRERDFERQRRAERGTTPERLSPPELKTASREGRDRLRQDLLKALEEGYARDYQALIRKYFEVLDHEQ
jgi:hypothetical protein